jgi:hypothetical protein
MYSEKNHPRQIFHPFLIGLLSIPGAYLATILCVIMEKSIILIVKYFQGACLTEVCSLSSFGLYDSLAIFGRYFNIFSFILVVVNFRALYILWSQKFLTYRIIATILCIANISFILLVYYELFFAGYPYFLSYKFNRFLHNFFQSITCLTC